MRWEKKKLKYKKYFMHGFGKRKRKLKKRQDLRSGDWKTDVQVQVRHR